MARGMPNTYVLVGGCLLLIIGLSQYLTLRSENAHLSIAIKELQSQLKSSSILEKKIEKEIEDATQERDSCRKEKEFLGEEKRKLKKEISDGISISENSKSQISTLQNEVDNLTRKLRVAEDSEKQATSLQQESKTKLDNAKQEKIVAEGKLEDCLSRENRVFDDLQRLKRLEKEGKQIPMKSGDIETARESLNNTQSKNKTQENVQNPIKVPKIHFEDEQLQKDEQLLNNAQFWIKQAKKDKEVPIDSNIAGEEKNLEDQDHIKGEVEKQEDLDKALEDPEYRKNAQLPNVDPSKIKIEKKDMFGNTYHKDENGNFMPIIVQGDPNKPRAKWNPPTSSKNASNIKKPLLDAIKDVEG